MKRGVRHVFCATDLISGKPFYFTNFSDCLMGNSEWGTWRGESALLVEAVRSSAAFPGAFPPKRLKLRPEDEIFPGYHRVSGREPPPRAVFLADGGVWNNLGTAWFDEWLSTAHTMAMDQKAISELSGEWAPANTRRVLVINASAKLKPITNFWLLSVPLIAEAVGFFRFINVVYASTLFPRTAALYDTLMLRATARSDQARGDVSAVVREATGIPAVVQIEQNHWRFPLEQLVERGLDLFRSRELAGEISDRSRELPPFDVEVTYDRRTPAKHPEMKVPTLARVAASVPTTLSRIAPDIAFQVLLHGYLSTWRVMETIYGPKPMRVLSIKRFAEIAGVRNLNSSWNSIGGRLTLKLHFTKGASGTHEEAQPMQIHNAVGPLASSKLRPSIAPSEKLEGIWTAARLGDRNAMLSCGMLMMARNHLDEAADWFIKADRAGAERGGVFLARSLEMATGQAHRLTTSRYVSGKTGMGWWRNSFSSDRRS